MVEIWLLKKNKKQATSDNNASKRKVINTNAAILAITALRAYLISAPAAACWAVGDLFIMNGDVTQWPLCAGGLVLISTAPGLQSEPFPHCFLVNNKTKPFHPDTDAMKWYTQSPTHILTYKRWYVNQAGLNVLGLCLFDSIFFFQILLPFWLIKYTHIGYSKVIINCRPAGRIQLTEPSYSARDSNTKYKLNNIVQQKYNFYSILFDCPTSKVFVQNFFLYCT